MLFDKIQEQEKCERPNCKGKVQFKILGSNQYYCNQHKKYSLNIYPISDLNLQQFIEKDKIEINNIKAEIQDNFQSLLIQKKTQLFNLFFQKVQTLLNKFSQNQILKNEKRILPQEVILLQKKIIQLKKYIRNPQFIYLIQSCRKKLMTDLQKLFNYLNKDFKKKIETFQLEQIQNRKKVESKFGCNEIFFCKSQLIVLKNNHITVFNTSYQQKAVFKNHLITCMQKLDQNRFICASQTTNTFHIFENNKLYEMSPKIQFKRCHGIQVLTNIIYYTDLQESKLYKLSGPYLKKQEVIFYDSSIKLKQPTLIGYFNRKLYILDHFMSRLLQFNGQQLFFKNNFVFFKPSQVQGRLPVLMNTNTGLIIYDHIRKIGFNINIGQEITILQNTYFTENEQSLIGLGPFNSTNCLQEKNKIIKNIFY